MNPRHIHVTPHFHYDVIFLKTYEEYLETTLDLLKKALAMMDRVKDYTFNVEQTIVLEEFLKRYPRLRGKLTKAIQSGRLEVTCGMYVMPDLNLPSGESLFRQIERGRKWLKATFGLEPTVCHITDCFGHHRQIPQILKKCGYEYYLFSRGMPYLAPTEFWWEGIDGTKILTHWNYRGYGSGWSYMYSVQKNWDEVRHSAQDIAKMATTDHSLFLLGGDFCPPLKHSPQILRELSTEGFQARFSTLTGYMNAVKEANPKLATIDKEFNPLFEGCYSSRIYLKQLNRRLENELLTLEKVDAVLTKNDANCLELGPLWDQVLLNQFHDTICGSIVDPADQWTMDIYRKTQMKISRLNEKKMKRLALQVSRKGKDKILTVFNPTLSISQQAITVKKDSPHATHSLIDHQGHKIPVQKTNEGYLLTDSLPSLGFKTYRWGKSEKRSATRLKVTPELMESPFYRLQFTNGVIRSLIEKKSGVEYVNRDTSVFNTLAIQLDYGDPWLLYQQPHSGDWWKPMILPDPMPSRKPYKDWFFMETKYNNLHCDRTDYSKNRVEVIEQGLVRIGIRIKGELALGSTIKVQYEQEVYLYADIRRIDFITRIVPSGKRYRLRICFATTLNNPKIVHEIPFGSEQRCEGEFTAQNWVNYKEKDKNLLLLNRGLPGNNFQNGVAMISLFRSVTMDGYGNAEGCFGEGCPHQFEYAVIPYTQPESINPTQEGQIYNAPPAAYASRAGGSRLNKYSVLEVTPPNVALSAFRKDREGFLLRLYETEGKPAEGVLTLSRPVKQILEVNGLGDNIRQDLPMHDGRFIVMFKPFEIKTYRILE